MRRQIQTTVYFFVVMILGTSVAVADGQRELFLDAAKKHAASSDLKLQQSSVHAMQAVMYMGSNDIKNARKYGQDAYSLYQDAVFLDIDASRMQIKAMSSRTKADPKEVFDFRFRKTTYSRLDPGYLHKGQPAIVSTKFEKLTGMSRTAFLKNLSYATDNELKGAGQFTKAIMRFKKFVTSIPNAKFRRNIELAMAKLPAQMATEKLKDLAISAVTNPLNFPGKLYGMTTPQQSILAPPINDNENRLKNASLRAAGAAGGNTSSGTSGSGAAATGAANTAEAADETANVTEPKVAKSRFVTHDMQTQLYDKSVTEGDRGIAQFLSTGKRLPKPALFTMVGNKLNEFSEKISHGKETE